LRTLRDAFRDSRSSEERVEQEWELDEAVISVAGEKAVELAERRRQSIVGHRGWLVRRALVVADLVGLITAFAIAERFLGSNATPWDNRLGSQAEIIVFFATLPGWLFVAKLYGLYTQDEKRTDHSTADDFIPMLHVVTVGLWLFMAGAWVTGFAQPRVPKLLTFWALAIVFATLARAIVREICWRLPSYVQNTVVVGAGEVGRLIARKLAQHPEYGLSLVGFVDWKPGTPPGTLPLLGSPRLLPAIVRQFDVERVIVTPAGETKAEAVAVIHDLKKLDVHIDIVPRVFEVIGPRVNIHSVEGVTVIGLPPTRLPRASMLVKRAIDITLAFLGLVLSAPLFAYAAWRIKRESPGPVFFRQTRLGMSMREITMLKFRTMSVGADEHAHQRYIAEIMDRSAAPESSGLYKLERAQEITQFGRWLRKTSLDELPQLVNVLRGDMSLVGPRPCLAYETEHFEPHHFERFNVLPGLTGLWQVTARARATFVEALEMDVAYVRNWSLGLDLWLLARTPLQLFLQSRTG
jgi:exopolysaccharide biosynthesis polyprenyl glycosylphosphotransferase